MCPVLQAPGGRRGGPDAEPTRGDTGQGNAPTTAVARLAHTTGPGWPPHCRICLMVAPHPQIWEGGQHHCIQSPAACVTSVAPMGLCAPLPLTTSSTRAYALVSFWVTTPQCPCTRILSPAPQACVPHGAVLSWPAACPGAPLSPNHSHRPSFRGPGLAAFSCLEYVNPETVLKHGQSKMNAF